MSFGTSILEGFWKGLGMVGGGQNPRFSHFFRDLFDAKFGMQLGILLSGVPEKQHKIYGCQIPGFIVLRSLIH